MTGSAPARSIDGFMSRLPDSPPSSFPSELLRVGDCIIDVALREVHASEARQPRRITPKSMSVLLVLVENAGKVVARDALLAKVWPETLPTNDVVTQAITQLRKAFSGARGHPLYIETISKTGYRLLVPVEWITSPPAAMPSRENEPPTDHPRESAAPAIAPGAVRQPQAASRPLGGHLRAATVILVALLLTMMVWAQSRQAASPQAPPHAPAQLMPKPETITSSPGSELAPTLSPDASMVAYMAAPPGQRNMAIMVQTTAPTAPRQLTRPGSMADDTRPQWSPDGRELAFLRVHPGRSCEILVIPAAGGAERNVGSCNHLGLPSFDWTPDGRGLLFSSRGMPGGRAGLHVLDLATGDWRPLEYAARIQDVDMAPRYSPDGRWIVFVRNSPSGDFWRLPATGGTAERLTDMSAEIRGWDWSPGGRSLVYSRRNDSASRLYRFDLASGAHIDLGIEDGEYPVMAANTPALAYVHRRSYFGIHRFDLDAAADAIRESGKRLFASSGRDRLPAIAPDGRQLVFTSDRSGDFGLWWADLGRGTLRLLPGVRPESRHVPSWSADSRRVLIDGTDAAGQPGIFEVQPVSGQVSRLPIPLSEPVQAVHVPSEGGAGSERILVVAVGHDRRLGLTLFDRSVQPWRPLARVDNVSLAQADPTGRRVLFTRPGAAELWQADLQLSPSSVRRVTGLDGKTLVMPHYRAWAVSDEGGVYTASRRADCPALLRQVDGGTPSADARCLDRDRRAATTGFSVNARTGEVFVALSEWSGGDINYVALDQPAEMLSPGAAK